LERLQAFRDGDYGGVDRTERKAAALTNQPCHAPDVVVGQLDEVELAIGDRV
jgi:hypothetical protein